MPHETSATNRYRATVEYDGADFCGYQVQPGVRTVQFVLEAALARLANLPETASLRVVAAGRTDTGVHALGQEVAFDMPTPWELMELERALNAVLPADLAARNVRPAEPDFHPRFHATARRYEYYICPRDPGPLRASRVWTPSIRPDPAILREAAQRLLGRRAFDAFAKSGQPARGTECTIERAEWSETGLGDLRFTIVADRFLHHMVRYIVATLVDVAAARRSLEDWSRLLHDGSGRPPEPAPPHALYLTGVRYRDGWNRDAGVPGLWPLEPAASFIGLEELTEIS